VGTAFSATCTTSTRNRAAGVKLCESQYSKNGLCFSTPGLDLHWRFPMLRQRLEGRTGVRPEGYAANR